MTLMSYVWLGIVIVVAFLSDILVKIGSQSKDHLVLYSVGVWLVWGFSAYPWMMAARDGGIITITVLFMTINALLCIGIGLYYGEHMTVTKLIGIVLAILGSILITKG